MRWPSPGPEATRDAAARLARSLDAGLVVALVGPLGAGKTVFAKGLAEGLGLDPDAVASPTFVIASEYPVAAGPLRRLVHADLYRIESEAELEAAGLRDWLAPGTLLAVEWADRFPDALPGDRLEVVLSGGAGDRVLEIRALGPASEKAMARWRQTWR